MASASAFIITQIHTCFAFLEGIHYSRLLLVFVVSTALSVKEPRVPWRPALFIYLGQIFKKLLEGFDHDGTKISSNSKSDKIISRPALKIQIESNNTLKGNYPNKTRQAF